MRVTAYIGLGSNMADPVTQLRQACQAIATLPKSSGFVCSGFYRSRPMGPQDQPDYVNAVAALETDLPPLELLTALQAIEHEQGRVRDGQRWGPRTLDLDILLYGDSVMQSEALTIPHAGLFERNFVLYPLYEIAPDLVFPDGRPLREVIAECPDDGLEPLAAEHE